MATENAMQVLRQYSAESRQFFNSVSTVDTHLNYLCAITHWKLISQAISENGRRIDVITDATRNAWSNLMRLIQQMKETAAELTDPSILSEHLRVMFRDESEFRTAYDDPNTQILNRRIFCFVFQLLEIIYFSFVLEWASVRCAVIWLAPGWLVHSILVRWWRQSHVSHFGSQT